MPDLIPYTGDIIPTDSGQTTAAEPVVAAPPTKATSALAPYEGEIVPVGKASASVPQSQGRGFVQDLRDYADKTGDLSDMTKRYTEGAPDWVRNYVAPIVALPEAITRKGEAAAARAAASVVQGTEDLADVATQKDDPHTRALNAQIMAQHAPEDIQNAIALGATPFNPGGEMAGGIRSFLPSRGELRNPEAAQLVADFDRSGITPTAPAVTGSRTLGNLANVTKEVPFVGEGITDTAKTQLGQAEQRSKDIADLYGEAADIKHGGESLNEGYSQFKYGPTGAQNPPPIEKRTDIFQPTRNVGFVPKSDALYDDIGIAPDRPAVVSNTVQKLGQLQNLFQSNPKMNSLMANPEFAKFYDALKPGFVQIQSDTPYIAGTPPSFAMGRQSAPEISLNDAAGSPHIVLNDSGFGFNPAGRTAVVPTESGFASIDTTELQPTGGLSWQDLKNFRSFVGRQMRKPTDQLGVGPDDWKALYGPISEDMKATATQEGPDALKGFNRANGYYAAGLDRLNDAMGFIDKSRSDEDAFEHLLMKGSARGRSADIDRFEATVKSLPPEFKGDVAAATINRLGQPTAANADIAPFSINTWATRYNTMSPRAKDALFGSTGTQQRDDLEALANSISALKGVQRLGNPSGSGRLFVAGSMAGHIVAAPFFGGAPLIPLAGELGGAYGTSKLLTSPGFARWLANSTKVTTEAGWANQMSRLGKMAAQNPGVIGPYYEALSQSMNDQPQQRATGGRINAAARMAHRSPSEAQIHAGNYQKGHIWIHGLDVTIENAKGSIRKGVGDGGKPWRAKLAAHYGYIKRTEGADGEHVDAFIGPDAESDRVFVVDQINHNVGSFDEHKAMMNFPDITSALDAYAASFSDGNGHARIGNVKTMTVDQFKDWLKNGDTKNAIAA